MTGGNTLIFGSNGGVIVNNVSGKEIFFKREQGVYVMHSRMQVQILTPCRRLLFLSGWSCSTWSHFRSPNHRF